MKRTIGNTNLEVNPIGLGAMPLSIEGRPDETQAAKVIEAFVDGGGNFIDTANVYCLDHSDMGHNERLIQRTLKRLGKHEEVVVATKGGLTRPQGRWETDGRPKWLRQSCEQSLLNLDTDMIPFYQLHAVDSNVPFTDSLGELIQLKDEGKIQHIGLSNVDLEQVKTALRSSAIISVQNRCNPFFQHDFHNGLIEFCHDKDVTYIPYSPVGGHHGHLRLPQQPALRRLSEKYGESPYCIVLAWLLNKGSHILPIPGASRVESVEDSARAMFLKLESDDIATIDYITTFDA